VNSAALRAVGVSRETQSLAGDAVQKDVAGEPTGIFSNPGPVNEITRKIVPQPSQAELKEMLRKIQDRLHGLGLTSTREVTLPPEATRAYQELARDGKLPRRIAMGLEIASTDADDLDRILRPWGVGTGFGDYQIRLDSLGEFGMEAGGDSHFLREPYANHAG